MSYLVDTNVLSELRKGRRRDQPTAKVLEAWLQELVATHSDRILPVVERTGVEYMNPFHA